VTGVWVLLRLALKRDRVMIPAWVLGLGVAVAVTASSYTNLYATESSRREVVRTLGTTPATLALYGRIYADSVGGLVAWRLGGIALALAGLMTILLVTRRTRPRDPLASWLLATSIALVTSGQAVALVGQPSPSYADIPRFLAYPAMAGAILAFQRDRIRHDRASLLDALVVTVAAAQAGWLALIEPLLRDDTATLAQLTVAGAYPLGDLLVLGVLARLAFALIGSRDLAARLVICGLALGIGSEDPGSCLSA